MWKVFFILAIIWWTWRIAEDVTDGTSFSVFFLHLIFLLSDFVGLLILTG